MSYQDTANQIIKDSIKSAIFIDEKARSFYMNESELSGAVEERLSEELYNNFKINGVSLAVHRFIKGEEQIESVKKYLFDARDLVLLDWKLNDEDGEECSLQLLADIVLNQSHIHFCAIYTSLRNLDEVFWNILSYFSQSTTEEYEDLKSELSDLEGGIVHLISEIKNFSAKRFDKSSRRDFAQFCKDNPEIISRIADYSKGKDKLCSVINAGIAFSNELTSNTSLPCPSLISSSKRILTIGNTIITILNKSESTPDNLIDKFSEHVVQNEQSFMQLIGLEMQKLMSQKAAFIDTNILHVSKEAFIYHREQKGKEGFQEFIKEVLFEQARLHLRSGTLKMLDNELLDSLTPQVSSFNNDSEIQAINTFYNSSILSGERPINFGDVFRIGNKFFICITALCDCLNPKKNVFYFAEGKKITRQNALPLGDTAFVSYLPLSEIIRWSDDQEEKGSHFKPIYIKPISFIIPEKNIIGNKLVLHFLDENAVPKSLVVEYITTIKTNYTQRIANHAFSHPVRVGVDFVKK